MSVSSAQKTGLALLAVLVTGAVGFVVATGGAGLGQDEPEGPTAGTTFATPSAQVDVVPDVSAAQAAQAVSTRLVQRSDVAILTAADAPSRAQAIATAARIKVPVLLDDPAAPAELARLRATTVLTFGTTGSVVGATPITGDAAAVEKAVDAAVGTRPEATPATTPSVVLMQSATTFDVAAATAKAAGATVVETQAGDPRLDPAVAKALAAAPKSPLIAVGKPFTEDLGYTLAAVQAKATQLDGTYPVLTGKAYVSLYGKPGTPASGPVGRLGTEEALALLAKSVPAHAAAAKAVGSRSTIAGMLEVAVTGVDTATLTPLLDAAEDAKVYVVLAIQPADDTWSTQAQSLKELLTRPHVGLALEPNQDGIKAADVNEVSSWLADLVRTETLPQKLFVVHTSRTAAIAGRAEIDATRPEVATLLQVDVPGTPPVKLAAWQDALTSRPKGSVVGWTQFSAADRPMFSINQTWRLVKPNPLIVSYR